jgi:branched-chain amino acid transport system substrate-binding protein
MRDQPRRSALAHVKHGWALALAVVTLLAACSGGGGDDAAPVPTTAQPDTTPPTRRNVDGVLKIGVWLPATGAVAGLGRSLRSGVELAVKEINDAGGVDGQQVQWVSRDEGSDPATAYQALTQLLDIDQVDAIVGPASSRVALGSLDLLASARVVACSPTATALELDQRMDDGYFVRTIGSEALEAVALTSAMTHTGRSRFAVLYPDDVYGHDFADRLQAAFSRRGEEVRLVAYNPTAEQFNLPAGQAMAGDTEVVGVVGSGSTGAKVLASLARIGSTPSKVPTFVTSGLRRPDLSGMIDPRQPMAAADISGVSPLAEPRTAAFVAKFTASWPTIPVSYAAYAYDCANLIALAAEAAHSDDPEAIRSQLMTVSQGGSPCADFAGCAMALGQGQNIDLEGASGDIDLQDDGDVGNAWYDQFHYDAGGQDQSGSTPISVNLESR